MVLLFFWLIQPGNNDESGGMEGEETEVTISGEIWFVIMLLLIFAWIWYMKNYKTQPVD